MTKNEILSKVKKICQNEDYFLISDFYFRATGLRRGVSSLIGKIPTEYLLKKNANRGKYSGQYATEKGLIKMMETLPRFPLHIKELFGVYENTTSEQELEWVLFGLCEALKLKFQRQVLYKTYNIDFVVNDEIAIEFYERHHFYKNGILENERIQEISKRYTVFIFYENKNIGSFIGELLSNLNF